MAVKASLQHDVDIADSNDGGLWLIDPNGTDILVAREGDSLAGLTIASLSFFGDTGGNDGRQSGLNDQGQFAFQANFTNGDSGLFLYSPSSYSADFDLDGDVDSDDLTDPILGWEARYGNDLDGTDFLAWQEQFGSSTAALSAPSTAIPEPAASLLLCMSTLTLIQSRKRIRQLPL